MRLDAEIHASCGALTTEEAGGPECELIQFIYL